MATDAEGLTSLEALGIALRTEMDAREIYREMAERCEDPLVGRRFELLAAEEERHRDLLEERWRELAGEVELKLPPSRLPEGQRTREERQARSLLHVLDLAIEQEMRARAFYLEAAQETEDRSGQSMFRYLADLEFGHWMELTQERDLLTRYPHYGRPGPRPWQPESSLAGKER